MKLAKRWAGFEDFHAYLNDAEPKAAANFVSFWRERAGALPEDVLQGCIDAGTVTVVMRQIVREDWERYVYDVLSVSWEDAYAAGGGLDPARWMHSRAGWLIEAWFRDAIGGLKEALKILGAAYPNGGVDPPMLRALYGLSSAHMAAVARYQAQLLAKGFFRSVLRYARQLLFDRGESVASYEVPHAHSYGQEEAVEEEIAGTNLIHEKVWHADPTSKNICKMCLEMDGEVRPKGEFFTYGVQRAPLHVNCRCDVEDVTRLP